jgi:hypothetical protein
MVGEGGVGEGGVGYGSSALLCVPLVRGITCQARGQRR